MKRSSSWSTLATALAVFLLAYPATLSAQSVWMGQRPPKSFSIEWLKPSFDGSDVGFLTSALFLSGRVPLADNVRLTAELPVAHVSSDSEFDDASDTAIGNPYLGIELGESTGSLWGEIGVRAPLASSDNEAVFVGILADFDRFEAFVPDVLSIVGQATLASRSTSGFSVRLRGGSSVLINTDKEAFEDGGELYLAYSGQGWYAAGPVQIGAGVTGRMLVTEDDLSLGERSIHQGGLSLIATLGKVQPGIYVKVPLDEDLKDSLNFVAGLNLTVLLD